MKDRNTGNDNTLLWELRIGLTSGRMHLVHKREKWILLRCQFFPYLWIKWSHNPNIRSYFCRIWYVSKIHMKAQRTYKTTRTKFEVKFFDLKTKFKITLIKILCIGITRDKHINEHNSPSKNPQLVMWRTDFTKMQ